MKKRNYRINVIPLCLSCTYLAFIIGSTAFTLKLLILVALGYLLGLLTFYPIRFRMKKKKKAIKKVDAKTIIENLE